MNSRFKSCQRKPPLPNAGVERETKTRKKEKSNEREQQSGTAKSESDAGKNASQGRYIRKNKKGKERRALMGRDIMDLWIPRKVASLLRPGRGRNQKKK